MWKKQTLLAIAEDGSLGGKKKKKIYQCASLCNHYICLSSFQPVKS